MNDVDINDTRLQKDFQGISFSSYKKSDVKKMASTKHKGLPTRVKSDIDTSNIKDRLYDALNKKMGIK